MEKQRIMQSMANRRTALKMLMETALAGTVKPFSFTRANPKSFFRTSAFSVF